MLASTGYLRKKDGNSSRELRNMKRRCFAWSISLVTRQLAMHQGTNMAMVSLAFDLKNGNTLWQEATDL
jgi:hypothetical protein